MKPKSSLKISLKILSLTAILIAAICQNSWGWKGYDYDEKTTIEIGAGNLVRPGMIIDFYDFKDDDIHNAKVIFMESAPAGCLTQVKDFNTEKERSLFMEGECNIENW